MTEVRGGMKKNGNESRGRIAQTTAENDRGKEWGRNSQEKGSQTPPATQRDNEKEMQKRETAEGNEGKRASYENRRRGKRKGNTSGKHS